MNNPTPAQPPRCASLIDAATGETMPARYDDLTPAQRFGLTRERFEALVRQEQRSDVWTVTP